MSSTFSPAITVITSTYNWPSVLREAIKTALDQTFSNFEHLIIGDGCTDETEEVVREFNDDRIVWYNLPENTGNQSGVNKVALEMASADWIAYLNHDDLWFPDHLEILVNAFRARDLDMISSLTLSIPPYDRDERSIIGLPKLDSNGQITTNCMTTNVLHTKEAAISAGGWIDWRETTEIPTKNFFRRIRNLRGAYAVVNEITSLKFSSGSRKNCYREKSADEQIFYAKKISEEQDFRYRECMKVLAFGGLNIPPPKIKRPPKPENLPNGWKIEQLRVNHRGLKPMLHGFDAFQDAELICTEQNWIEITEDNRTLILNDPSHRPNPAGVGKKNGWKYFIKLFMPPILVEAIKKIRILVKGL